jgi:hypothetical protein
LSHTSPNLTTGGLSPIRARIFTSIYKTRLAYIFLILI